MAELIRTYVKNRTRFYSYGLTDTAVLRRLRLLRDVFFLRMRNLLRCFLTSFLAALTLFSYTDQRILRYVRALREHGSQALLKNRKLQPVDVNFNRNLVAFSSHFL